MMSRLQFGVLVLVVAFIWGVTVLLRGGELELIHVISFGSVITVTPLLLLAFDRWAWRWPMFRHWLVKRPIVDGTWTATLQSNHTTDEVDAIVVIRQRYSEVSVRLYTEESSSSSIARTIVEPDEDLFRLSYTYQNDPQTLLRGDRSEIHYGAAVIEFAGAMPAAGHGEYWTDRLTKGAISLSERSSSYASSFETGQALFLEK